MRTEIATLGEFGLIRHLTEGIELQNKSTLYGVGDDAAVLSYPADKEILVTTDLLLEGVHFDLTYVPLKHLGYKSAVVNFSDIYAMNGTPRQITVSLGISKRFCIEDMEALYAGIRLACEEYGVDIAGGDTTSSLTGLTISITCIGEGEKGKVVYRNGAKETDLICVSGDLGAAYMGLQLLEREKAALRGKGEEMQPDFAGKEYLRHCAHRYDGHLRRAFIRAVAHLYAESRRMPRLRGTYPYRLPNRSHGRRIQHEPHHLRLERRRRLRTVVHRAHSRPRKDTRHGRRKADRPHHQARTRLCPHHPRRPGI